MRGDPPRRILFLSPSGDQSLPAQLRAAGNEVSSVADLAAAQVLLSLSDFDYVTLPAFLLPALVHMRRQLHTDEFADWRMSASVIAHDAKSVLAALDRSLLALNSARVSGATEWELGEMRDTLVKLTSFLGELTSELADDRGKISRTEPVDLPRVLDEAAMSAYPLAWERRQLLSIEIDEPAQIIQSDELKLRRFFSNLLSAISQASPEHGRVIITASADDHDQCLIRLSYWGSPLPALDETPADRISHGEETCQSSQGRAYRIAEDLGARLWVEGNGESANTIVVSLPLGLGHQLPQPLMR